MTRLRRPNAVKKRQFPPLFCPGSGAYDLIRRMAGSGDVLGGHSLRRSPAGQLFSTHTALHLHRRLPRPEFQPGGGPSLRPQHDVQHSLHRRPGVGCQDLLAGQLIGGGHQFVDVQAQQPAARVRSRGFEQLPRAPRMTLQAGQPPFASLDARGGQLDQAFEQVGQRSAPAGGVPQSLPDLVGFPIETLVEQIDGVAELARIAPNNPDRRPPACPAGGRNCGPPDRKTDAEIFRSRTSRAAALPRAQDAGLFPARDADAGQRPCAVSLTPGRDTVRQPRRSRRPILRSHPA